MNLTPRRAMIAGLGLVLLVNTVVMTGVAFNRSGEPESLLVLSERELRRPWRQMDENSGMAMHLDWRIESEDNVSATNRFGHMGGGWNGGVATWLDEAKLAGLGFEMQDLREGRRMDGFFDAYASRGVIAVFELAGPAWQRELGRAREALARAQQERTAGRGGKDMESRVRDLEKVLSQEESRNSRLFAIDAGSDPTALRARYSDTGRYMLMHVTVSPFRLEKEGKVRIAGRIDGLTVPQVNLPYALRVGMEQALPGFRSSGRDDLRYEATLAVGRRLEPWIESMRPAGSGSAGGAP